MGETDTGAESVETTGGSEAETTETAETAETTTKESDGGDGKSSSTEEKGEQATEEDEDAPVRKPRTNADWVALRRQRKIEREQRKSTEEQKGEDGDDDDISPEDARLIDRRIAKAIAPFEQKAVQEQLTSEINTFVASNPEFKPYADKVAKWAQHPSWENVPVDRIFYAAAGPNLMKMGAQRKAEQDRKAAETRPGGSSSAAESGGKPIENMTDAEFAAYTDRIRAGQRA